MNILISWYRRYILCVREVSTAGYLLNHVRENKELELEPFKYPNATEAVERMRENLEERRKNFLAEPATNSKIISMKNRKKSRAAK